ncbi:hypothetical protein [Chengkuizengella axinellae]|uniref:Uncharacterized protein n=1 Tax=Chengkuizengella axinellae TaxID=3064388 RepID=A0ABT9J3A9_9BACL|nr:hypothetical protein [Chengkuizengella sp. 2205SS18-9]MDP5275912.1 hypothetical protein [Chengkuizengella sp. 2205SS18-9]
MAFKKLVSTVALSSYLMGVSAVGGFDLSEITKPIPSNSEEIHQANEQLEENERKKNNKKG